MLEASGLAGPGGAGFPAAIKLAVAQAAGGGGTILVNAMEGEPASDKDKLLLTRSPHLMLDGAQLLAAASCAHRIVVCVPESREHVAAAASTAMAERAAAGCAPVPEILVRPLDRFVAVEESALFRWVDAGQSLPSFRPDKETALRIGRRGALVHNAHETGRRAGRPRIDGPVAEEAEGGRRARGLPASRRGRQPRAQCAQRLRRRRCIPRPRCGVPALEQPLTAPLAPAGRGGLTVLRILVDPVACDAYGYCAELLPEAITLDECGYPVVDGKPLPCELVDAAKRAARDCPRRRGRDRADLVPRYPQIDASTFRPRRVFLARTLD